MKNVKKSTGKTRSVKPASRPQKGPATLPPLGYKIGILGGGQLARMLILAGAPLGLEFHILSPNADEPAAQVTAFHHQGDPRSLKDVKSFLQKVDALTFESEFFDMQIVEQAAKDLDKAVRIFPEPKVLREFQDRRTQKKLLVENGLPTSPFFAIPESSSRSVEDLKNAALDLGFPLVVKKAQGGYDGYGTFYAKDLTEFVNLLEKHGEAFIAEKKIRFRRELAIVAVRSTTGEFFAYPLVESIQTDSRCEFVFGPKPHPRLAQLIRRISKFMTATDYLGALGVEFFDTGREILVNEIAPRVHNTGHYTQNAFTQSQFELHLRAGLGLSVKEARPLAKAFAMWNLLGQSDEIFPRPQPPEGHVHWYGKAQNRAGRKMGHINWIARPNENLERLEKRVRTYAKKTKAQTPHQTKNRGLK